MNSIRVVDIDWDEKGCSMRTQGMTFPCPLCGVTVEGKHTCGNRSPKPVKRVKAVTGPKRGKTS